MQPGFQDTHPGGPDTLPLEDAADGLEREATPRSMRLLGALLGALFVLLHGYVLLRHGALGGLTLMGQGGKAWLMPWHGLWFLAATLGWLGLVGIVLQSLSGEPEDQSPGLRLLVDAGLLSCLLAWMPWLVAPHAEARAALGPWISALWLCLPLPFWLGWRMRYRALLRRRG